MLMTVSIMFIIQLPAHLPCNIFPAVSQYSSRFQISFKAAVVNTYGYIAFILQLLTHFGRVLKRVMHLYKLQMLLLFPDIYVICNNSCYPDTKAVFQRMNGIRNYSKLTF